MGGEADNNGVVWCSDILDSTYIMLMIDRPFY